MSEPAALTGIVLNGASMSSVTMRTCGRVSSIPRRGKELSKTAVIRQALLLFQLLELRPSQGEKLVFEDAKPNKKAELIVL